jgi:hypothetical protein
MRLAGSEVMALAGPFVGAPSAPRMLQDVPSGKPCTLPRRGQSDIPAAVQIVYLPLQPERVPGMSLPNFPQRAKSLKKSNAIGALV